MLDFRLPTEEDRAALESYVAEHRAAGETGRLTAAAKLESMPFGSWLSKVYGHTSQDSPKSSYVMLCLDTDRPEPDGMDSEQRKMMKKAAETVREAMKDSPAEEHSIE